MQNTVYALDLLLLKNKDNLKTHVFINALSNTVCHITCQQFVIIFTLQERGEGVRSMSATQLHAAFNDIRKLQSPAALEDKGGLFLLIISLNYDNNTEGIIKRNTVFFLRLVKHV